MSQNLGFIYGDYTKYESKLPKVAGHRILKLHRVFCGKKVVLC
jgi:hypothetical protein